MNFTDYDFLLFFLFVFSAYWLVQRTAWQNMLLLVAGFVFYGWAHPWYALLLGLSSAVDYFLAHGIARHRARAGGLVALSVLVNVGVLGFFKYGNFITPGLAEALQRIGWEADFLFMEVILPVGLSFYTLKKLAYILDVSRGVLEPVRDPLAFGLFVSFFPQITAGPIDRAQTLIPQIQSARVWSADHFYRAWPLIVMGFFKKIVIANTLSAAVDRVFAYQHPPHVMLLAGGLGFAVQVLADFSAYTDLARGLAHLFGFETSKNFDAPYLSLTPTEFWNRWHITLSTWLRDYIFFPLRRRLIRAGAPGWLSDALPPIVTMLVSGIWHGAGWTYVLWGGLFGILIVIYQWLGLGGAWKPSNRFHAFFAWLVMISILTILFLIFRAPSLEWLVAAWRTGAAFGTSDEITATVINLSVTLCFTLPLAVKHMLDRAFRPDSNLHVVYYVAATVVMFVYLNAAAPDFIYFRF